MEQERLFSVRTEGGVKVVAFEAKSLGIEIAPRLSAGLAAVVKGIREPKVLLLLEGVAYLSSPSIGAIINLNNLVKKAGGVLNAASLSPYVQETFRVLKLDQAIYIYPDEETGLASFR